MKKQSKSEICKQLIETARGRLISEIRTIISNKKLKKNQWIELKEMYGEQFGGHSDCNTQFFAIQIDRILARLDGFEYFLELNFLSSNELIKILKFLEEEKFEIVDDKYIEKDYCVFLEEIEDYR